MVYRHPRGPGGDGSRKMNGKKRSFFRTNFIDAKSRAVADCLEVGFIGAAAVIRRGARGRTPSAPFWFPQKTAGGAVIEGDFTLKKNPPPATRRRQLPVGDIGGRTVSTRIGHSHGRGEGSRETSVLAGWGTDPPNFGQGVNRFGARVWDDFPNIGKFPRRRQ